MVSRGDYYTPPTYDLYGQMYLGLQNPIEIKYNPVPGLTLISSRAAVIDTSLGPVTQYHDLNGYSNLVFQPTQYDNDYLGQWQDFNNPSIGNLWFWSQTHPLQMAVQLKFTYQNTMTNTTDTVYFLKTYPVSTVYDTSVFSRTQGALKIKSNQLSALSKSEKPAIFSVQNYPNPFNPTTNIEFQIANKSNVSLKVYDIVGREVAVLVNGTKEIGNYSVRFDGSRLSSGIYFLRLIASPLDGNKFFTETRKMILMK